MTEPEMLKLYFLGASVFGYEDDTFAVWMDRPNRMLHDFTPRELVDNGQGARVIELLEALADGIVI